MAVEAQSTQEFIQLMYKGGSMMFHVSKGTGKAGIKTAAYIQARLKAASENKVSGELDLPKLNKDGQPITCYNIRYSDFEKVIKKAKEFGLLYSVVYDKKDKNPNKEVLMFIRLADAVKLERILESLNIATVEPDLSNIDIGDMQNKVIPVNVDFGDKKPEEKSEPKDKKEEDDPFEETPSEEKSQRSSRKEERKPIRTEVERIKQAQRERRENLQNRSYQKNSPEELDLDEQLSKEFGSQAKEMEKK